MQKDCFHLYPDLRVLQVTQYAHDHAHSRKVLALPPHKRFAHHLVHHGHHINHLRRFSASSGPRHSFDQLVGGCYSTMLAMANSLGMDLRKEVRYHDPFPFHVKTPQHLAEQLAQPHEDAQAIIAQDVPLTPACHARMTRATVHMCRTLTGVANSLHLNLKQLVQEHHQRQVHEQKHAHPAAPAA